MQMAQYHINKDAAYLAMPTLAKAYHGVQCLPVATRQKLNIRLRDSLISVAVNMHGHNKENIQDLDCILKALTVVNDIAALELLSSHFQEGHEQVPIMFIKARKKEAPKKCH